MGLGAVHPQYRGRVALLCLLPAAGPARYRAPRLLLDAPTLAANTGRVQR